MNDTDTSRSSGVLEVILAAVAGFTVAELVTLIVRAPGLLQPAHWAGLLALMASALLFYVIVGLLVLAFWCLLWIAARALRLRLDNATLAVAAIVVAPLFLVVQNTLQTKILGMYISLRSPLFYLPTAITLGATLLVLIALHFAGKKLGVSSARWRRFANWRWIMPAAAAVFLLFALVAPPRTNVLGVFADEEERAAYKETPASAGTTAPAVVPNLIVLAIEALRSDEFTPENAPFLHKLISDEIYLENYYVVASATRPSVTSFFTSLYPAQHGCYNLALTPATEDDSRTTTKVADTIVSYPRLLLENGYRTLEITSNTLAADPAFGFEEVYNRFDAVDPYDFQIPTLEGLVGFEFLKNNLKKTRLLKVLVLSPEHSATYFDSARVNRTLKRRLSELHERPFCLYVHYMEPHSPYYHHPYRPLQINLYQPFMRERILGGYRSEIQAIDHAIEDMFGFMKDQGLLENTYVLITADHGEEFYDHRNWGHGKSLYPEVIHVPAILVTPQADDGRRVLDLVESIDIAPTFLDLVGLEKPEFWEGDSLVPLLTGEPTEAGTVSAQFDDGRTFWTTRIEGGLQLLTRQRGDHRRTMLFDLDGDPLAQHDLLAKQPELGREMLASLDSELARLAATAEFFQATEEAIDPEQLEQLRALGYVH
jgi:arylsulfatase A-like enzyme